MRPRTALWTAACFALTSVALLAANSPRTPACPAGSHQPAGAPPFNANPPQPPTPGSEYEAIANAIAYIDSLTESQLPGNSTLAACLRSMLRSCQICITDANSEDFSGEVPNFDRAGNGGGWYGDQINLDLAVVTGATTPPGGTANPAGVCYLAAVLAHEAVHAGQSNTDHLGQPIPINNQRAKDIEEPAVEAEKALMRAWGMEDSATYRFKCAWLEELCDKAARAPLGTLEPWDCPQASGTLASGGFNSPPTPTLFGAVYGVENTIYVGTGLDDGSDRDEYSDIRHVTDLVVYADRPQAGWHSLLVIGHNASQQNAQYQWLTFDAEYVLQGSSNRTTIPHCTIRSHAKAPDGVTTYFWDDAQEEVLVSEDSDGDGLPDLWSVFADAATYPEIQDTVSLQAVAIGDLRTSNSGIYFGGIYGPDYSVVELRDTDGDGTADETASHLVKDVYEAGPLLQEQPEPGKTSLLVFGTPQHTVQLWRANADGDELALLGEAPTAYGDCLATIPCPPLAEGTFIVIIDTANGNGTAPIEVALGP